MSDDTVLMPAVKLASTARCETVQFLANARAMEHFTLSEDIKLAVESSNRAIECLLTACADKKLTVLVINPQTGARHPIPAEYFDRPSSVAVFEEESELDLANLESSDPIRKVVQFADGWACVVIEREFRDWLENSKIGPLAGPRQRPFYHVLDEPPNYPRLLPYYPVLDEPQNNAFSSLENTSLVSASPGNITPEPKDSAASVQSGDEVGKKITQVIGAALRRWPPPTHMTPSQMANELKSDKQLPYGYEAKKKILEGSYRMMVDRGITSPYRSKDI